jgi:hypothetical protein
VQQTKLHLRETDASQVNPTDALQRGVEAGEQRQNDNHDGKRRPNLLECAACNIFSHPKLSLKVERIISKNHSTITKTKQKTAAAAAAASVHTSSRRMSGRDPGHSRKSAGIDMIAANSSGLIADASAL